MGTWENRPVTSIPKEKTKTGLQGLPTPILGIKTHYKPTDTFQYTHFSSCHPPGVKRGFIKGEAIILLRTNSSKTTFEECLANYKRRLEARGYPKTYIERSLSEVTFDSRQSALNSKNKKRQRYFCLLSLHTTLR